MSPSSTVNALVDSLSWRNKQTDPIGPASITNCLQVPRWIMTPRERSFAELPLTCLTSFNWNENCLIRRLNVNGWADFLWSFSLVSQDDTKIISNHRYGFLIKHIATVLSLKALSSCGTWYNIVLSLSTNNYHVRHLPQQQWTRHHEIQR